MLTIEGSLFYFFSLMAIVSAFSVIFQQNPVHSALSLVLSFFSVAAIYFLFQAPFLGVIQVLIYTGAILVLFLYVIMLLKLRANGPDWLKGLKTFFVPGLFLIVAMLLTVVHFLDLPEWTFSEVGAGFGSTHAVSVLLLRPFAFVFELSSAILLAAMVGVVVLTHKKKGQA